MRPPALWPRMRREPAWAQQQVRANDGGRRTDGPKYPAWLSKPRWNGRWSVVGYPRCPLPMKWLANGVGACLSFCGRRVIWICGGGEGMEGGGGRSVCCARARRGRRASGRATPPARQDRGDEPPTAARCRTAAPGSHPCAPGNAPSGRPACPSQCRQRRPASNSAQEHRGSRPCRVRKQGAPRASAALDTGSRAHHSRPPRGRSSFPRYPPPLFT